MLLMLITIKKSSSKDGKGHCGSWTMTSWIVNIVDKDIVGHGHRGLWILGIQILWIMVTHLWISWIRILWTDTLDCEYRG